MPKLEQAGVAQPNEIEQAENSVQQQPSEKPDQTKPKPKDDEDLPGADGPSSAGANEDTYD
ncbi:MAG: hypothetical protein JWQ22_3236 [Devosia sp.]|nr:hypothetical protein [Devosia sp.]